MRTIAPVAFDAMLAVATAAVAPTVVVPGELGTRVEREYVQLTDVTSAKDWAGMGARGNSPQDDTVAVSGLIWTSTGSDSADVDMMHRAFDLLGMIEDAIAADITLGDPRLYNSRIATSTCKHGATSTGGRAASLEFSVLVRAYLS